MSPSQQSMLVSGSGDEIIREIRPAVGHSGDIINGQVQFLKLKPPALRIAPADQLVAGDR